MHNNPLLSIIIPTKNRYSYLTNLLISFSGFKSSDFEVVIQDNSENNEQFVDWLGSINDSRIKYFYERESLSIVENSEYAIKNSLGKYLCFIGDDDGVIEEIIEFVNWMKINSVDSAVCHTPNYYWPDIVHKIHDFSGSLSYYNFSKKITHIDPKAELRKCLNKGGSSLELMPHLYHGVVSRKSLEILYSKCSSYFPGPSPDMANAVALSTIVKNHVLYDCPIIIAGAGFKSAGGAGARKAHVGKIEDMPFLPKDTSVNWEEKIPKIWTGQTIWAESAIKALKLTENDSYLTFFNYNYFYASFFVFHSQLIRNYSHYIKNIWQFIAICLYVVSVLWLRFKFLVINVCSNRFKISRKKTVHKIENIESCIILLNGIVCSKKSPEMKFNRLKFKIS